MADLHQARSNHFYSLRQFCSYSGGFFFFLNPNFYPAARTTGYRGGRAIARSMLKSVEVKKSSLVVEYNKRVMVERWPCFKVGAAGVTPLQKQSRWVVSRVFVHV